MGSHELPNEEKLKRFLYTTNFHGAFITGGSDKHVCKFSTALIFQWAKTNPTDFLNILTTINDDPYLVRRSNLFYITANALHSQELDEETKLKIKDTVFKLLKSDSEFFDFLQYFTLANGKKHKLTTSVRKMIWKFYAGKSPEDFAQLVTKYESYHSWSHKDLIKLCHFKCDIPSEPVVKYVLFGPEKLPQADNKITDLLKKSHELRTTEDVSKAVKLIDELQANVDLVNSKLNKNEEVWLAALAHMSPREILKCLFRFFKFNFLKSGGQFQAKVIQVLSDADKVKKSNLHPVEVFIYLKFFEKGGKAVDPQLLDYLKKKEIKEETMKKITTPCEPKIRPVVQSINKCLKLSYDNVQPSGKKFLITIDVTEKIEDVCFHNRRITFLEGVMAFVRFLCKVEKSVTVAVFKDGQINVVDVGKYHSAIEKLQEHKSAYIVPTAPIDWARNKKKQIDVFINFMSCNWYSIVPLEAREKMPKLPEALAKYSQKMKSPDTRVIKMFLGGPSSSYSENAKNILSVAGLTVEVPRVLEAFINGRFC